MNSEAKQKFLQNNMKLTGLRKDAIDVANEIRESEKTLDILTNSFVVDIANQIDPDTCKAKYSNSEKRDAELLIRQTNSDEWMQQSDRILSMKSVLARVNVDIMAISNEIHYDLNHVSDEFEGELRAFRSSVSEEIQISAAQAARMYVSQMLYGLSFNISQDQQIEPPEFVNKGTRIPVSGDNKNLEIGKLPEDPYTK